MGPDASSDGIPDVSYPSSDGNTDCRAHALEAESKADRAGGSHTTSNATKAVIAVEIVGIAICMLLIAVLFIGYFRREARAVGYFGSKTTSPKAKALPSTTAALGLT